MELKQIKSNITWIKTTGAKFDTKIHETAVAIMEHASIHADFSLMNKLFEVMPKSSRREAFKVWVVDFTPLHFDDKLQVFIKAKANKTEYRYEAADATPFWEHTKEVAKSLDVSKMTVVAWANSCLKRIQTAEDDGAELKGDVAAKKAELLALAHAA